MSGRLPLPAQQQAPATDPYSNGYEADTGGGGPFHYAMNALGRVLSPAKAIFRLDRWLYTNAVSRPISTVAQFENPYSDAFLHPKQAYNQSEVVSPGQALAGTPMAGLLPLVPGPLGMTALFAEADPKVMAVKSANPLGLGFDPYKERTRVNPNNEQESGIFVDSKPLKMFSGTADFAINWYLDPLVVGGKGLGLVRRTQFGQGAGSQHGAITAARLANTEDIAAQRVINQKLTPAQWYDDFLVRHSGNRRLLASLLGSTYTPAERALVIGAAAGDASSFDRLLDANRAVGAALDQAGANAGKIDEELMAQVHATMPELGLDLEHFTALYRMDDVMSSLEHANHWLSEAVNPTNGLTGIIRENYIAQSDRVTRMRISQAGKRHNAATGYWSERLAGIGEGEPVRILRFIPAKPRGWVAASVKSAVGFTPAGWLQMSGPDLATSGQEIRAFAQHAGFSAEQTDQYMTRWLVADSEQARLMIHGELFADGLKALAAKHGYPPEEAQKLIVAYQSKVVAAMEEVKQNSGFFKHADGSQSKYPDAEPLLANGVPLPNLPVLDQLLRKKRAADLKEEGNNEGRLKEFGLNSYHFADDILSGLNSLWKPSVLLRVGYTGRTVGESLVAATIRTGTVVGDPVSGVANTGRRVVETIKRSRAAKTTAQATANVKELEGAYLADRATLSNQFDIAHASVQQHAETLGALTGRSAEDALADLERTEQSLTAMDVRVADSETALADLTHHAYTEDRQAVGRLEIAKRELAKHIEKPRDHVPTQRAEIKGNLDIARKELNKAKARLKRAKDETKYPYTPGAKDARIAKAEADIAEHTQTVAQHTAQLESAPRGYTAKDWQRQHDAMTKAVAKAEADRLRAERGIRKADKAKVKHENLVARRDRIVTARAQRAQQIIGLESTIADLSQHRLNLGTQLTNIDGDLAAIREAVASVSRAPIDTPMVGSSDFYYRNMRLQGAYNEQARAVMRQVTSAEATNRALVRNMTSERFAVSHMGAGLAPTGNYVVGPDADNYYPTLAETANRAFRSSPWLMDLVGGKDPAEVANWLRHNADGQDRVRRLGWHDADIEDNVLRAADVIAYYFPDAALRAKIMEGPVTASQVKAHLIGHPKAEIHGRELLNIGASHGEGLTGVWGRWNNVVNGFFEWFGTRPENAAARFPFYATAYEKALKGTVDANYDYLLTLPQERLAHHIEAMEAGARGWALHDLKQTIYTVDQRSNLAVQFRYMIPFLQVTANRFGFYGRMAVERPSALARLFVGFNAIPATTNDFGDEVIPVTIPRPVAKMLGLLPGIGELPENLHLEASKKSLNLIGQGSPWYSPGFGPPVTVPAAYIVRNRGDEPGFLANAIIPYGAGRNPLYQLLPTTVMRTLDRNRNSAQWAKDYALIGSYEAYRHGGGMRDKPTAAEIAGRADTIGALRSYLQILSPVSVSVPRPMAEQANYLHALQRTDPDNATALFMEKYPDYYEYMISVSKSSYGLDPSGAAVKRQKMFSDVLSRIDEAGGDQTIAGLIVNDPNHSSYTQESYNWQQSHPLYTGGPQTRSPQTLTEGLRQKEVSAGWQEYMALDTNISQALSDAGLVSLRSKGAEQLSVIKRMAVQKIAEKYPSWSDVYLARDGAYYAKNARTFTAALATDDLFADPITKAWAPAMVSYLSFRNDIANELIQRSSIGGSASWDALSNGDLVAMWDVYTKQLSDSNPAFADVFKTYFENDNMLPAGVS